MAADTRAVEAAAGAQRSMMRRRAILLASSLTLTGLLVAACTTGDVFALKPAVDVGTETASLPVIDVAPQPQPQQMAAVVAEPAPMASAVSEPAPMMGAVAEPVLSLPEYEPAPALADVAPAEPAPEAVPQTVALAPARGLETLVPSNPQMVAYPRPENPAMPKVAPPRVPAVMPADEVQCRSDLKALGVQYRDLPPINDGAACGIDYPVRVSAIGSVQMKPAATVTCAMAASFAAWTKRELVPAARLRYFSGVKTIHQGSSYSCRKIAGTRTLSEHGKGNALDIMRIELNSGRDIDVKKPGLFAFRTRGFLNTVRADGCNYFNTVLGPGYNYDHRNHFHFDIKQRRNGYRACR